MIVTVPASYVRALLHTLEEQGHDLVQLAGAEDVGLDVLMDDEPIPAALFGRLYQRAMWLLKDESLGMVSGGRVPSGTFRMLCLCVIHCETLNEIIHRAGEFLEICQGDLVKPRVTINGDTASLGFQLLDRVTDRELAGVLRQEGPLRIRTSLYMWQNLLGWFAGRPIELQQVSFDFPSPVSIQTWQYLFACPLQFDSTESALNFPVNVLSAANLQNETSLEIFLKSAPYRLIAPTYQEKTARDRVLAVLGDDFTQPLPDAAEVADRLNLSISTLRRHLSSEGTSFQLLKDECRRAAALRYLGSTDLTLNDIAILLGFDESSAFFRAFKRWTGVTPNQYRQSTNKQA